MLNELTLVDSNTTPLDSTRVVKWEADFYLLEVEQSGEFKGKAIRLPGMFEWVIGYDSYGHTILVAMKPKVEKSSGAGGATLLRMK